MLSDLEFDQVVGADNERSRDAEPAVIGEARLLPVGREGVFLAKVKDLLAARPAVPREDDGDGRCSNPACVDGMLPNYGGGSDTPCPDCLKRTRLERLYREFELSDIPVSEMQTAWDDVNLEHPAWQAVKKYCQRIKDVRAKGYNAIFVGPPGRGKSLAGALVCRAAIEASLSARMLTAYELISRVRATYSDTATETERDIVRSLSAVDFLVIDDLAAGETKHRVIETRIYTAVIDAREKARKPTVLTSNLTEAAELEAALGFRALERLRDRAAAIIFDGENERRKRHTAEVADLHAFILGEDAL